MQNREEVNMDIIVEDLPSFLKSFSTLQNLYQLEQHLADENERLALKVALDNAVTQLVQSHAKTVGDQSGASSLEPERQKQDVMLENQVTSTKRRLCSNCGKSKKLKTAATKVKTELDVIQRFKASGHIGDDKVFPRKEMKTHSASSIGAQTQPTNSSGSYTSSEELDSPPHRVMQLDHHRIYRPISSSRTPRTHYARSTSSSTSYSSSEEEDYPARSRSRYSKDDPPRRISSSSSYSSSQEEDYPVRRRSRYSKADPPQKKPGHVRRFMNKIAGMFHHDRLEDTDASLSDHHLSDHHHHHLRRKSKEKRMQKRRTASVNKPMRFPNTRRKASDG
ncbi:hypothetical protein C5167_001392 [Papaver somniferum]|uniref:Uncharacterized protein n=1 Tax=Papaver somniferum TaxID=3469 RepID=A0A4Y7KV91_PAPSO|nr:hypothetical protein C5167_001392 [Papaver somniferum]